MYISIEKVSKIIKFQETRKETIQLSTFRFEL